MLRLDVCLEPTWGGLWRCGARARWVVGIHIPFLTACDRHLSHVLSRPRFPDDKALPVKVWTWEQIDRGDHLKAGPADA